MRLLQRDMSQASHAPDGASGMSYKLFNYPIPTMDYADWHRQHLGHDRCYMRMVDEGYETISVHCREHRETFIVSSRPVTPPPQRRTP